MVALASLLVERVVTLKVDSLSLDLVYLVDPISPDVLVKNGWLATSARSLRKLTTSLNVGIARPSRSIFFRYSPNLPCAHFGMRKIILSRFSVFISPKQSIASRMSNITWDESAKRCNPSLSLGAMAGPLVSVSTQARTI